MELERKVKMAMDISSAIDHIHYRLYDRYPDICRTLIEDIMDEYYKEPLQGTIPTKKATNDYRHLYEILDDMQIGYTKETFKKIEDDLKYRPFIDQVDVLGVFQFKDTSVLRDYLNTYRSK